MHSHNLNEKTDMETVFCDNSALRWQIDDVLPRMTDKQREILDPMVILDQAVERCSETIGCAINEAIDDILSEEN
jgi:hypothetical protein